MKKRSTNSWRSIAVSITVSILLLTATHIWIHPVGSAYLIHRLGKSLLRMIGMIAAGLLIGQWIESSGWTSRLAIVTRPFFRFGRLGPHLGASFMAAFVSGVTANSLLLTYYEEGKIGRKDVFLGNLMNQFPAFFLHLPSTFFMVSALTRWAGMLYFALTFLAALLRTTALVIGHRLFAKSALDADWQTAADERQTGREWKTQWKGVWTKALRRLTAVVVLVIPIYILVDMMQALKLFDTARDALAHLTVHHFVPVESLSIVVLSFVAEFTSGFAAAGALMGSGLLTVKQTVLALLLGNVIAFPIRALRHQLPNYMGIFSPGLGMQLLVTGQVFRVASIILIGALYAILC
ncbi:hypothetical protein [Desulfatirhabdium butyrativorans]|uniref:hypothetical protein n=1 Tax=Desulfatirhabdium butyrativorans TaxID=340467 RepID=UPI0003FDC4E0|nr:hypothetical protein [Desulfatirhabdium butyrativorans]